KWRDGNVDRQAKLMMLLKDYDKELTPHFTLLTPEDRERIFHEVFPASYNGYHYQTSHERLEFHETGNAQRLIDMYGKNILHVEGHGWYTWDDKRWKED